MRRQWRDDTGSAVVEFLGVTVVLLVPLVYLIIAVAQVQAGSYAAESAARSAARAAVVAGMDAMAEGNDATEAMAQARTRAAAALKVVAGDFSVAEPQMDLRCTADCLSPGSDIVADVTVRIPLPGVPTTVLRVAPLVVTVSARGASPVDGLAS